MVTETYLLDLIRNRRKNPFLAPILQGASQLLRLGVYARHFAYDHNLLTTHTLPVPVVSIGNVTAGGTGKTPVTHLLTLALQEHMNVAILTRGYRSSLTQSLHPHCLSTGQGPLFPPDIAGDEPYLLAQKTKAAVWVGKDRVQSGQEAIRSGAQCLLLDDGMQHRRLHRDFEIVVIDSQDPFSQHRFLPRGLLRDTPKRLAGADLIILTHCLKEKDCQSAKAALRCYTEAPIVGTRFVVSPPPLPPKVGLFCGIGTPERFCQTVRDLNCEIVDTLFLKDHAPITEEQLNRLAKEVFGRGAEVLVCTEKDWVKLPPHTGIEVVPICGQLHILFGQEHWDHLVDQIRNKVRA